LVNLSTDLGTIRPVDPSKWRNLHFERGLMGYVENVRRRRRRRLVVAALVSASVLSSGTAWGEETDEADPTLLAGQLADTTGQVLSGASVLVSAWPRNEAVHRLPIGGEFDLTPLGRTVTDGAGRYRLVAPPVAAALSGENGLDLQLDVFRDGRHWTWLTQVVPGRGGWARAVAGSTAQVASHALDVVLDPAGGEQLLGALPASGRSAVADRSFRWCPRYRKVDTKVVPETVATAIVRNGAVGHVTYTSEARTESTTGVSYDGGMSFNVSGTRTRVSHLDAQWAPITSGPGRTVARDYIVGWEHTVLRQECLGLRGGWRDGPQVVTSADRASGYALDPDSRHPVDWDCADPRRSQPASAVVATESERAHTYDGDFSFAPIGLGRLTGRATSGYSKDAKVEYDFSRENPGMWCGDTGFPTDPGQLVQAVAG
jgi:hypothetical protein